MGVHASVSEAAATRALITRLGKLSLLWVATFSMLNHVSEQISLVAVQPFIAKLSDQATLFSSNHLWGELRIHGIVHIADSVSRARATSKRDILTLAYVRESPRQKQLIES